MFKEDSEALHGNDRFEGYNVDLIKEIADILGFNYTFKVVEDGSYGSFNPKNKTWNGMIGELLAQVSSKWNGCINSSIPILFITRKKIFSLR